MNLVAIRAAAKKIALDSRITPGRDVLGTFDRDVMGGHDSVRIILPLKDPTMLKAHLGILARTITECLMKCEGPGRGDRGLFIDVRARLRDANRKLNAYKKIRND